MKRSLIIFLALLPFAIPCPAEEISCPLMIEPIPDKLPVPPNGWETIQIERKTKLAGFEISFGDPRKSDNAIYDDVKTYKTPKGDKAQLLIWELKNVTDPYVKCSYGGIALIRNLKGFKRCEVEQTTRSGFRAEITSARCF